MSYTTFAFISCWMFHAFNWPHTLNAVPNCVVYNKKWISSYRVVNFRRDSDVITKWANTCFELLVTFSPLIVGYPLFTFLNNILEISTLDDGGKEARDWILSTNSWIYFEILLIPLELLLSSYIISFWHVWQPIAVYLIYVFKTSFTDKFDKVIYPGLIEWNSNRIFIFTLLGAVILLLFFGFFWILTFYAKKTYITAKHKQTSAEEMALFDMQTRSHDHTKGPKYFI